MAVAEEVSAPPAAPCGRHHAGAGGRRRRWAARAAPGRSYADAPEIDGTVRLLPPEKISKTLKAGEFTKARVVATQGHDLVAVPV
jgi:ribosomal protein S12 methylthiotransferase